MRRAYWYCRRFQVCGVSGKNGCFLLLPVLLLSVTFWVCLGQSCFGSNLIIIRSLLDPASFQIFESLIFKTSNMLGLSTLTLTTMQPHSKLFAFLSLLLMKGRRVALSHITTTLPREAGISTAASWLQACFLKLHSSSEIRGAAKLELHP